MSRENFDSAFDLLMDIEGYESNDKRDPGRRTKYGIASAYHPEINLDTLTREGAKDFYLAEYWKTLGCDELKWPFDVALFIQGVNMGAAKRYMDESDDITDFFIACLEHYATRPKAKRDAYLTGWCNRLVKLHKFIKGGIK